MTTNSAGREYYPLRTVDVLAIGAFWFMLGIISAVGRQLDPRIPGLSSPVVEAVVRATYVEYALWAVLTLVIMWLTTRYSIEGGRRIGRILIFVALGMIAWKLMTGRWPWEPKQSTRAQAMVRARKLLGVSAAASREEILTAHKRLVAMVHPDRGGSNGQVHEANAARDLLLDELPHHLEP